MEAQDEHHTPEPDLGPDSHETHPHTHEEPSETIREEKHEAQLPSQDAQPVPDETTAASYEKLPLHSVRVQLPHPKESLTGGFMVYPVSFVWNGREFEVFRRYSDFAALRDSLRSLLPFTHLCPAHRRQFIVRSAGEQPERVHSRPGPGAEPFLQGPARAAGAVQPRWAYKSRFICSSTARSRSPASRRRSAGSPSPPGRRPSTSTPSCSPRASRRANQPEQALSASSDAVRQFREKTDVNIEFFRVG